jgi:hypothetical protein
MTDERTRGCNTYVDMEKCIRHKRMLRSRLTRSENDAVNNASAAIYIGVYYTILYRSESENISLERLQDQHYTLNLCMTKANRDVAYVPSSGNYNFSAVVGNANIIALPTDAAELAEVTHIRRIQVSSAFNGVNDALDWLETNGHSPTVDGKLNIIIAPLNGILGQAPQLITNVCICDTSTVGGFDVTGTLSGYDLGKTLVHEVGHCLGLPHTFDQNCSTFVFSDIPPQYHPNSDFELYDSGNGVYDGRKCNRFKDCKVFHEGDTNYVVSGRNGIYSCFTCHDQAQGTCTSCATTTYEQAMNYMDYSRDAHIVMFSTQQSLYMRQVMMSGDTGIDLLDADGNVTKTAKRGNGLAWYIIVAIVIGCLLFLFLGGYIYQHYR